MKDSSLGSDFEEASALSASRKSEMFCPKRAVTTRTGSSRGCAMLVSPCNRTYPFTPRGQTCKTQCRSVDTTPASSPTTSSNCSGQSSQCESWPKSPPQVRRCVQFHSAGDSLDGHQHKLGKKSSRDRTRSSSRAGRYVEFYDASVSDESIPKRRGKKSASESFGKTLSRDSDSPARDKKPASGSFRKTSSRVSDLPARYSVRLGKEEIVRQQPLGIHNIAAKRKRNKAIQTVIEKRPKRACVARYEVMYSYFPLEFTENKYLIIYGFLTRSQ